MPDPAFVFKGVAAPFFEGCHNLAIAGCVAANEVSGDAFRPMQNGHLCPPLFRK
jgi:hypothetical protein